MSRKYNLSKKSDLRRFSKDLEQEAYKIAKEAIETDGIDTNCPSCGNSIHVNPGDNICPFCNTNVVVNVNLD